MLTLRSFVRYALAVALLTTGFPTTGLAEEGMQPAVLRAAVRAEFYRDNTIPAVYSPPASTGANRVVHQGNGHGLGEVTVHLPQLGYVVQTGPDGGFDLPALPNQPVIASFSKPGFVPKTVTLDSDWQRERPTLHVALKEIRNTLILDNSIRHLGDGSYSPVSAGADRFQQGAEGPVLVRQFPTPKTDQATVYLEIGSIIGLDTEAAHRLGQSRFHRSSTPMQVRLNGKPLTQITANGDAQRIPIPVSLLRQGMLNTVEIRTGHQSPDGTYLDYDDIELMLLTLQY